MVFSINSIIIGAVKRFPSIYPYIYVHYSAGDMALSNINDSFKVNWDRVEEDSRNCPQSIDEKDAEKVCSHLQIPFYVANFVDNYWNEIFA